jgi:chemotaxis response regulator CheB
MAHERVVVVGASAGGVEAVKVPAQLDGGEGLEIMQGLPPRGGV